MRDIRKTDLPNDSWNFLLVYGFSKLTYSQNIYHLWALKGKTLSLTDILFFFLRLTARLREMLLLSPHFSSRVNFPSFAQIWKPGVEQAS